MNIAIIARLALGALSTGFAAAGETDKANTVNAVLAGMEAGQNVDVQMEGLAKAVGSGEAQDWETAHANIKSTLSSFLSR